MIIVRLCGGLGNQMFQYALARTLSLRLRIPSALDLSWFTGHPYRHYVLDVFNTQIKIAQADDLKPFQSPIARFIDKFLPQTKRKIMHERGFSFDSGILSIPDNRYVDGYWQSEKYFTEIRNTLQKEFTLKTGLGSDAQKIASQIRSSNAVSLHVRRGDYVSNPKFPAIHGVLPLSYYAEAMKLIEQKAQSPHYFLFSDDPTWVTQNIKSAFPITVVSQKGIAEAEDLTLMSICKHNIIANSSFSWWGAWLNNYGGKIVVAPKNWFGDTSKDMRDLIPSSWMQI